MPEIKPKSVKEQVEARLKELGYWPCPPQLVEAAVSKVNDKLATVVKDTLKSWSSVSAIATAADPTRKPAEPARRPAAASV